MPEVNDKYHGEGGSYVRDPQTGLRTLVERTDFVPPTADTSTTSTPTAAPAPATPDPATTAQG